MLAGFPFTNERFAVLLDGAFLLRRLKAVLADEEERGLAEEADKRRVLVAGAASGAIKNLVSWISKCGDFEGARLLRIYFYNSSPSQDVVKHPVSKRRWKLKTTVQFKEAERIRDEVAAMPNLSYREGSLAFRGWALKGGRLAEIRDAQSAPGGVARLDDGDFVLNLKQKGVDVRIALDIARLSMGGLVDAVVLVTGDSDFVPAMKFARREGVRVYLAPLGMEETGSKKWRREMREHSDVVLSLPDWHRPPGGCA